MASGQPALTGLVPKMGLASIEKARATANNMPILKRLFILASDEYYAFVTLVTTTI